MMLAKDRLVKCCLTDGSIMKDYTSMLYDSETHTDIPAELWDIIGPNGQGGNQINDIAATSDYRWLFAACGRGWWAIFDLQQDKCVSRKHCTPDQSGQLSGPTSLAVSSDDQLLYMVTDGGTVESYDIQAKKAAEIKSIPNQFFKKITIDPKNQFVFIASESGNLYKYDTGQKNQLEQYQGYGVAPNAGMLLTRDSHYLFFASGDGKNLKHISKFSIYKKELVAKFEDPAFESGVYNMALSPDSNSLYVASLNKLHQFSLKDGKFILSRDINERPDIKWATIYAMKVTRNNLYLVTGITYFVTPEKGAQEDLSGQNLVPVGGPVCVWSTKDLTLIKTQDFDTNKLIISRIS